MYKGEEGKKAYEENSGVREYPNFTDEIICKGSITLGTGCGTCSKCLYELSWLKLVPVPQKDVAPYYTPPIQQGWKCPVCGRGNAPHISTCSCTPLPAPYSTC